LDVCLGKLGLKIEATRFWQPDAKHQATRTTWQA